MNMTVAFTLKRKHGQTARHEDNIFPSGTCESHWGNGHSRTRKDAFWTVPPKRWERAPHLTPPLEWVGGQKRNFLLLTGCNLKDMPKEHVNHPDCKQVA